MDVEQAMTVDPHVTNLGFASCGSIIPKPEQMMVTSVNDPCNIIGPSAPGMYRKEGGKVGGELQDLVNEDGSLKNGHHAIKRYIRLLQLGLEPHGLDRSSYMGDVCVLLNPLLNTTELSVLECFMTHKGLHVLNDMLRRFRPIFEARYVLCKLMKTLQHLHGRNMLVVERMQCDPPRFCMEDFSKLLCDLSEDEDVEVHTMAHRFLGLRVSIPLWHPLHAKCWAWGSAAPHAELRAATNHASSCTIL